VGVGISYTVVLPTVLKVVKKMKNCRLIVRGEMQKINRQWSHSVPSIKEKLKVEENRDSSRRGNTD